VFEQDGLTSLFVAVKRLKRTKYKCKYIGKKDPGGFVGRRLLGGRVRNVLLLRLQAHESSRENKKRERRKQRILKCYYPLRFLLDTWEGEVPQSALNVSIFR